ncbi:MAG: hypothetical protein WD646_11585 [Actinomycetota bacterium]
MSRGKKKESRAAELREQAKEVAGQSGEALKEFAGSTGTAAKEFAEKAGGAVKELVESVERAAKKVQEPEPEHRRGRRFLRTVLALGVGVAVLSNERARGAISSAIRRMRGGRDDVPQPEIWRSSPSPAGNNEVKQSVTEETT